MGRKPVRRKPGNVLSSVADMCITIIGEKTVCMFEIKLHLGPGGKFSNLHNVSKMRLIIKDRIYLKATCENQYQF